MKRGLLNTIALLLFSISATKVWAQQVSAELEPSATHIGFTLSDTLHTVNGSFQLKSGAITFDPSSGKANGALIVDAASGESGNRSRDKKMSREVLEAQKFPEITFTAREVVGKLAAVGPSHLEIHGIFSIHGQDHPLTLQVDTQSKADMAEVTTKFEVPYVAWGMKNPSVMFLKVGEKVKISIQSRVRLKQFAAAK